MESTKTNISLGGNSFYFQTFHFIIKEDTIPYRTNRNFKDRMFQLLFSEKDAAWELFCALEGDEFMEKGDAGRLEIVTLRDAVGNKKLNDLAYQYDLLLLSIVEHQSTWSENMPLRELAYLGRTYEKILDNRRVYERRLYRIPSPHFYVLYNGDEDRPLEVIQRLSDAYLLPEHTPWADLMVKVININYQKQHPILSRSKTLREYALFVDTVRQNRKQYGMNRDEAIQNAVHSCVERGILKNFLETHGSEVENMFTLGISEEEFFQIRLKEYGEELAEELAEEKAKVLAEEKARVLAEEKAKVLAEKKAKAMTDEKLKQIVSRMAADGIPPAQIAKLTELPQATVAAYIK